MLNKLAVHNDFGKKGEALAKAFLEENNYEILEENWCFRKAEVDLIAYKNGIIVFVEVKTRSAKEYGLPEDFVDDKKQKSLTEAAEEYIYLMGHKGEIRFDIVSILLEKQLENYKLTHIQDAFWNY